MLLARTPSTLLVAVAWLSLTLAAPSRAHAQDAGAPWDYKQTWVLMVGVLEWQDKNLAPFPKEGRFDRVLEKRFIEDGVPREQVTFLEDRKATRAAILAAMNETASRAGPGSTLVVYYAGHGLRDGTKVYFAPYDADTSKKESTAWAVDEIRATLEARWRGRRLVLFADCCHSGALESVVKAIGASGEKEAACITSSTASNVSTGNWTFTESLIAGFSGDALVDADRSGALTFHELDRFVQREMRFKEGQLTEGQGSRTFPKETVLRPVDPKTAIPEGKGPWRVKDYVEVESQKEWWRAQVLEAREDEWKVHFIGWGPEWDEWVKAPRIRRPTPLEMASGDKVEIEWEGKWYPGKVLRVKDDFALVQYDGFGEEWNEWVTQKRCKRAGAAAKKGPGGRRR